MFRLIIIAVSVLIIFELNSISGSQNDEWHWSWECDVKSESCQRKFQSSFEKVREDSKNTLHYKSLQVCRLICGKFGALWPKPTDTSQLSRQLVEFRPSDVYFHIMANAANQAQDFLVENSNIFRNNILAECKSNCTRSAGAEITVIISISTSDMSLNWNTNESYTLDVSTIELDKKVTAHITAENVFGARYGLETLSQLIASYPVSPNGEYGLVIIGGAKIRDKPIYPHRGLLLDTSRNYLPLRAIKRQIDGMAASKLNVLHWHATDSQSFPLSVPTVPQLARYGAYSSKQVYTSSNIQHLLDYAKVRGIRIILEIDAPSHSGNGWQWGSEAGVGDLAVCVNQNPWRSYCIQPPCGQLNPVNSYLYGVLGDLYGDIVKLFPKNEAFHMGGDEVFFACWNSSEEIINYLEKNGKGRQTEDFLELWGDFQAKALRAYDSEVGDSSSPIILWSSALTEPNVISKYLSKSRYVIETWVPNSNDLPRQLLSMGYKLIISTKDAWYLDHGFWGVTQYYTWRTAYNNRILRDKGVLGGETCMWGELVDENSLDARIWPRAAAVAERLWSDPDTNSGPAEPRMYRHRERLITRGIGADALAPRWCYQNEGQCM